MKTLLMGGVADGAVVDAPGQPHHLYIAQTKPSTEPGCWTMWYDNFLFKPNPPLKHTYVCNDLFEGQCIYLHQPLTVRWAAAALMAAYHYAIKNGFTIGPDPDRGLEYAS